MHYLFYLFYYNSLFSNLTVSKEEEYDKDHRTHYIEEGHIPRIVIFFTLILVCEVCKTNKHFCRSLVGSFDPPYQGPQLVHGDGFQ
jgi:hypothetical protein